MPDFLSSGILVVERDDASAEMMERFLKAVGYRNALAISGSGSAIDLLYEMHIDLLLIDSQALTTLDGRDILETLKHSHVLKHLPVIVLTSDDNREVRLRVLSQGAQEVLSKPVDGNEMKLRLQNTLAAKAYRDLLVYHDDLTGLPNQERYTDRLDWAIKYALRYGGQGAILHIDIDRFKKIVEGLGWATGDRVLRTIAKKVSACLRDTDIVAKQEIREHAAMLSRLSGNEFTILLCGIARPADAAIVAQRIVEVMREPISVNDYGELKITCSIGIAVFPGDGRTANDVVSAANNAMHDIKRAGGDGFCFFSSLLNERAAQRLTLEADLRRALTEKQFTLLYQPKIDIQTSKVVGAEALLRWQHPERGLIAPSEFIQIAEESALIHSIGDYVCTQLCCQILEWQNAGLHIPRISINVSPVQFAQKRFIEDLTLILGEHGLSGKAITLEITEGALLECTADNINTLKILTELGFEIAIDDFGTGYSSLAHLKRLPLNELKIDRSFLAEVPGDRNSCTLVTTIISMAHQLGLRVVAEGVETEAQLNFLAEQECDIYQGFHFSPPLPARDFSRRLLP